MQLVVFFKPAESVPATLRHKIFIRQSIGFVAAISARSTVFLLMEICIDFIHSFCQMHLHLIWIPGEFICIWEVIPHTFQWGKKIL